MVTALTWAWGVMVAVDSQIYYNAIHPHSDAIFQPRSQPDRLRLRLLAAFSLADA